MSRRDEARVERDYRRTEAQRSKERKDGEWQASRAQSPIASLRAHNNWLKAGLLSAYLKPGDRVLDLCCGSGGDARKARLAGAKRWDGLDACADRVEEARRRCERETRFRPNEPAFVATACRARATDALLRGRGLRRSDYYDCVTCFFAIHYFWDESRSRELVRGIRRALYGGRGVVLIVLPDAEAIEAEFARSPSGFGNSVFSVSPSERNVPGEYRFRLTDAAVSDTPEKAVPVRSLVDAFLRDGFSCQLALRSEQLDDWLLQHPASAGLAASMRPSAMSPDERQVAGLYAALAFVR